VHPAVAALALDEKGFVLGAMLARLPAEAVTAQLGERAGARCAAAVATLALEPKAARVAATAELIAVLNAPVPAGIELVHAGWLRERLTPENDETIAAVTRGLPAAVRAVAAEILAARGAAPGADTYADAEGVAELQRAVFGGVVPLAGPAGPRGRARELIALPPESLIETIARHGAVLFGASLRGAPAEVVARAAAGLGARLGPALLDAAAQTGTAAGRDAARAAIAALGGETGRDACFALGLPLVAPPLGEEGPAAVLAVALRLPPHAGRALLAAAEVEEPWAG
jgi:hypothetical protein